MAAQCLLAILTISGVLGAPPQPALAQQPGPVRMEPFYPTFSPWLRLYSTNTGPLDNYHTFVRPELQMREMIQKQNVTNMRQAAGLATLQNQYEGLQRDKTVRPTGTGSVFMNYSHYYDTRGAQNRFGR